MAESNGSPLFLGIDLGTSSCKVALTDAQGRIRGSETRSYPLSVKPDGGVEQDPEDWWKAVGAASSTLLERSSIDRRRIRSIGATGQWSGTVAVGSDGQVLRPAVLWMDTRGEPFVRALTSGFPSVSGYRLDKLYTWLKRTGGAPAHSGKDSLAHILYLKNREPDLYRSTRFFLEPKDYLNYRLTGTFSASWDNVVVTWVTDNRDPAAVRYDDHLFRLASLDPSKFPPLRSAIDRLGPTTPSAMANLGLSVAAEVVAGAGDMQASLIGTGCTRPSQFHLYLGTSSWLTAHVREKRTDVMHNIAALPSAIPGSYLVVATQESAGSSLAHVRELLYGPEEHAPTFEVLSELASQASPADGHLIYAPWLYGERAPVEDRHLRGAFFNLALGTHRPQLLRAVMEGVAYNTRWILGPVEKMARATAEPIRVAGGGARSPLWCQILADVLQRRVEVVEDPAYATARGAALLGAVGIGAASFDGIPDSVRTVRRCVPNPATVQVYDRMYAAYQRFHASNTRLYHELNRPS